jgi:hypothetical protein
MTASTRSAFPTSVDELLPRVREWVADLGTMPSRNQVMREFKVGAPKATAILAALGDATDAGLEVEAAGPVPADTSPVRVLHSVPVTGPDLPGMDPVNDLPPAESLTQVTQDADPGPHRSPAPVDVAEAVAEVQGGQVVPAESATLPAADVGPVRKVRRWPIVLLALPAFVAIWGGWVGLGRMTGFGPIVLLPGIWDELVINSAITLPIGVEAYAAFAMSVWLSGRTQSARARGFAMWSALGSLALGMAGQVAYHLMSAAGITDAPWLITTFVACLPVVVLGCGAALLHLLHEEGNQ